MPATLEITHWHWVGFIACVLFFLALDLGVFHRKAHVVSFKEAFTWTGVWVFVSLTFGLVIAPLLVGGWTRQETIEFVTGYIIELSLSMDNVFVIALIFGYFQVRLEYQHRVLFWGILGALIMRGVMIGVGAALVAKFHWILYFFGGFLVITGFKMIFADDEGVHPEHNPVVRLARRFFPVAKDFDGQHFTTRQGGRWMLTPLALVLIVVETTDLVFAVDSIPAIFGVTQETFVVFTSNVFAILGLRSLYFVLAGMIGYFRFLKIGLSIVLIYIGGKMVAAFFDVKISSNLSLGIVVGIIMASMIVSLVAARRTREEKRTDTAPRD